MATRLRVMNWVKAISRVIPLRRRAQAVQEFELKTKPGAKIIPKGKGTFLFKFQGKSHPIHLRREGMRTQVLDISNAPFSVKNPESVKQIIEIVKKLGLKKGRIIIRSHGVVDVGYRQMLEWAKATAKAKRERSQINISPEEAEAIAKRIAGG